MLRNMRNLLSKLNRPLSPIFENLTIGTIVGAVLYITCPPAFAEGGGPGNGGDAVKINGKWMLLDLAEAGITKSVQYEKGLADYRKYGRNKGFIRYYVGNVFRDPRFTEPMKDGLAAMLEWIGHEQGTLVAALGIYTWDLVDAPLAQVGDEQSTLDLSKLETLQLAIRRDNRIQIDSRAFAMLDVMNQVALILHEMAYALTIPREAADGTFYQPSWQARTYVAARFRQYSLYRSMADQEYSPGDFIFEATNRISETMGASGGSAIGKPVVILSPSSLANPGVNSLERGGSYVRGVYETGYFEPKKKTECRECSMIELTTYDREIKLDSDTVDQLTRACESAKGNRFYGYVMYRKISLKMVPVLTALGNTMRPVISETESNARPTEIDFGSIEQCKERVGTFVAESANYIQKQNELSRGYRKSSK